MIGNIIFSGIPEVRFHWVEKWSESKITECSCLLNCLVVKEREKVLIIKGDDRAENYILR